MKVVVTGGAGFLGSALTRRLLSAMDDGSFALPVDRIESLDLAASPVADHRVTSTVGDIADRGLLEQVITKDAAIVFHLAAVLSGGSEEDFDLAHRVNITATTELLEAARLVGTAPRFVFTSSVAVFGGLLPAVVAESHAPQPESTYGTMKAIGELLVNEYSRKGYVDGLTCRLPTISVRPGSPNSAVSSFASGIVREPLNGKPSVCPVPHDTRLWLSSPDTVVDNLLHAAAVDADRLDGWRVVNLPGISVTVAEMLECLERIGGTRARRLVVDEPDENVTRIVRSFPGALAVDRALHAGFVQDGSFAEAVERFRAHHVNP
ncbi:D-erythronate dehydrogenase [Brevibacterium sp.]|uniref:D-erythronate dehydrogenase n=1 Tax=Brevibacterium sp. TaxID=1701 RepID=UPI0028116323|nr:D-erythronate dehydrogenase [Brevibacterium sp.]